MRHDNKIVQLALGEAFQQFNDFTLQLKNVVFNDKFISILLKLDRMNITNLYLDQCESILKSKGEKFAGKLGFIRSLYSKMKIVSFVFSANPDDYE